jgi:PhnB protein
MKKRKAKKAAPKTKVSFQPKGYNSVTAYLSCRGAAAAIDFYRKAFGAREIMRMPGPEGKLGHAEVQIGDSRVMLSDEHPTMDFLGPQSRGGTSVHLHIYVKDCDAVIRRAAEAGAKVLREPQDQFYGDRSGSIEDPFGHVWHLATHKEDLSPGEIRKRAEKAMPQPA